MAELSATYETLTLKRSLPVPPARVFALWEDVAARERWAKPEGTAMKYVEADFRVGGRDRLLCGAPDDMRFEATVFYLDIIENRRIVSAESISEAARPAAAALVTAEFAGDNETELTVVLQIVSYGDAAMIEGYREGWTASLNNLAAEF